MLDRQKFRAWDITGNKMIDFNSMYNASIFLDAGVQGAFLADRPDYVYMQCTGLKDKNGQLIFEGDKTSLGEQECTIEFDDACFWITHENCYAVELHTIIGQGDIEIIGNIYDGTEG